MLGVDGKTRPLAVGVVVRLARCFGAAVIVVPARFVFCRVVDGVLAQRRVNLIEIQRFFHRVWLGPSAVDLPAVYFAVSADAKLVDAVVLH